MARGHPDFQTWEGRSVGAGKSNSSTFLGAITAGNTGTITFPTVDTGKRFIYQYLEMASNDDTGIHFGDLYRNSDSTIFHSSSFVTQNHTEFPGFALEAGDIAKLEITNNASSTVTFLGVLYWIEQEV